MFFLYSSLLNPKAKVAQEFLDKNSIQYNVITIDENEKEQGRKKAETLLQIFHQRASRPLTLPFLTQQENGDERIVLLGFVRKEWEEYFQLQASVNEKEDAEIVRMDRIRVPVVGAEEKRLE